MDLAEKTDQVPTKEHMPTGEAVEEEDEDYDDDNLVRRSYHEIFGPRRLATSMHVLILLLIAHHPNLRSIEIMDAENHGGIAVKDEAVSNIRYGLSKDSLANMIDSSCKFTHFMVWYETTLKLKTSSIEIEKARLVICTHKKYKDQGYDSDDSFMIPNPDELEIDAALPGGFEHDEDGVLEAAMAQLLAQHEIKAMVGPV